MNIQNHLEKVKIIIDYQDLISEKLGFYNGTLKTKEQEKTQEEKELWKKYFKIKDILGLLFELDVKESNENYLELKEQLRIISQKNPEKFEELKKWTEDLFERNSKTKKCQEVKEKEEIEKIKNVKEGFLKNHNNELSKKIMLKIEENYSDKEIAMKLSVDANLLDTWLLFKLGSVKEFMDFKNFIGVENVN